MGHAFLGRPYLPVRVVLDISGLNDHDWGRWLWIRNEGRISSVEQQEEAGRQEYLAEPQATLSG